MEQTNTKKLIPNGQKYSEILSKLKVGGINKLQLILDFDGTITSIGGLTSWGVIESYDFSQEYKEKLAKEFNYYHPIEIDHTTPYEEKVKKMVEWWNIAHSDLTNQNLLRKTVPIVVNSCKDHICFRTRTREVFDLLELKKIPCLIFSAGIGDTIVEMLKIKECLHNNIHVVSNFMVFDSDSENSKLIGWNDPLIHVFNKHSVNMEKEPYYKEINGRENIILMGDSVGDRHMADGLPINCILKIGLLNVNSSTERIDEFSKYFDIVAIHDNTMNILMDILNSID